MKNNLLELVELIKNNPDLPVYAWVDSDVVQDDCHRWLGRISGSVEIREYIELDYSYTHMVDCEWLFKDDTEEWEEYMLENYLEEDMSEEEAEKKIQEELNNMNFKKGIFVYVDIL